MESEKLKSVAERLAKEAAVSEALAAAGARGRGAALRSYLLEGDRIQVVWDSNNEPLVQARNAAGRYCRVSDVVAELKKIPSGP